MLDLNCVIWGQSFNEIGFKIHSSPQPLTTISGYLLITLPVIINHVLHVEGSPM